MAFSNDELSDIRYYLGRSDRNINEALFGHGGFVREWEELNDALNDLTVDGEDRVRDQLAQIRAIDTRISSALDCMEIQQVGGDAKFRDPAHVLAILRREGRRLISALARYLSVSVTSTPFGCPGGPSFVTVRG